MKCVFCKLLKFLFLIWVLHVQIASQLFAQSEIVLDSNNSYQRIGKSVYYLKDPKREIQFNDIIKPEFDSLFKKSNQDANNLGNIDMAVWNKFTITNHSNEKWLLAVENYSLDSLFFYYPDSIKGGYQFIRSGRHVPFSELKYKSNNFIFDLPVPRDSTVTFYLKVDTYIMQYPLAVLTRERFIEKSHTKDLFTGIFYGFVLVLILYNLFVYLSVKDESYIYYVIYIFFNAILVAQLKGLTAEIFGNSLHFLWSFAPVIIAVSSIVVFIFTRNILLTKKKAPLADKIIVRGFFSAYLCIIILSLLGKNLYASLLNQLVGIIGLLFLFTIAVRIFLKGYKPARFYIIASSFYFLGVIIYTLKTLQVLPFNTITDNAIEAGSVLQMILLSFVIADRLKIMKKEKEVAQIELVASLKEKEKLITEQNYELEIKVKERTFDLTKEKERSEELLLNILPAETAKELKETGTSKPTYYKQVTVFFTDIKGFTQIAEKLSPEELVLEMNICFSEFDRILSLYNVEKIKTIGDSYMAAGGLPVANTTNAADMVKAGIAILNFMRIFNQKRKESGKVPFEMRMGMHTGPVVAGIVGTKKFAYDIWGDTVNIASRMESSGEEGKINISGSTYELIKDEYTFIYRGKISAKNKGKIDMYFLEEDLIK